MPKVPAKRPIIQYTADEGVQVQPKHGKEMQELLRKARITMMRLDAENQTLKRLQESAKYFTPKSDCDAETSTDDIPKRHRVVRKYKNQDKKFDFKLNAVDTLDSLVESGGSKMKTVYETEDGILTLNRKINYIEEKDENLERPTSEQILHDFSEILDKKRRSLNKKVSDFQKELNADVKSMLRKSKKDNPQVIALKESFDRIGRMISTMKTNLDSKQVITPPFDMNRKKLGKIPEETVREKREEIIEKLRELSRSNNALNIQY